MICIAGKNNIACEILKYALKNYSGDIFALPNSDDLGVDGWQKSFLKEARKNDVNILKNMEELKLKKELIFLSLEYNRLIDVDSFKSEFLYNIHFSLLPKYKGMYTSAWPILNNEKFSGVTLHKIDRGIDTGDIIEQIAFEIGINDTARDLYFKYLDYSIQLVKSNWEAIVSGNITAYPQNKYESTYYDKKSIDYKNIKINLMQTALSIHNQIRAFSFYEYQMPSVYSKKIIGTQILDKKSNLKPGTIIWDNNGEMAIATIDYDIIMIYDTSNEET